MSAISERPLPALVADLIHRPLSSLVGGSWIGDGDEKHAVFDPATGAELATYRCSTTDDVDSAVASARRAQSAWAATPPAQRSVAMLELADLLEMHAEELSTLEAIDAGKPIAAAREEIGGAIDVIRFNAGACRSLSGQLSGAYLVGATSLLVREPFGVVGAITPWNFPLLQAAMKVAPAVAGGNAIVIKPSELTPLSTIRLAELAAEVLPVGLVNVVLGIGPTVGEALSSHMGVDVVSFTGSVAAGRHVGSVASGRLRPSVLELGGNSPVVIFDDADIERAIETIATAGLYNAGQECMAAARLIVHEKHYDNVVAALAERVGRQRLGDSLDETTQLGPLSSVAHRDRVEAKLQARSGNAEVVVGGKRHGSGGYYLEPTVVANVANDEPLVAEETFGPVFTVQRFREEAQALELANGTAYGLAASTWTNDVGRALRVGRALKAGTVWVNDHLNLCSDVPVTGFGNSGYGTENGEQGILTLTRLKHLAIHHGLASDS